MSIDFSVNLLLLKEIFSKLELFLKNYNILKTP
jgi:hypothetical protein